MFFLDHLGQAKVFFRSGLTIACLNTVGNVPESSGCFTTWVSAGTISSEQSSKRDVVIGSRSHVLKVIFFKRAETAVSLTALKWVSGFPEKADQQNQGEQC